jgi:hypothetical protein
MKKMYIYVVVVFLLVAQSFTAGAQYISTYEFPVLRAMADLP